MPKVKPRSALAHTETLLANVSVVPISAEAVDDSSDPDRDLVAVSINLRVAIAAFNDDLVKIKNPGLSSEELKQLEEKAFNNIQNLSAQMATLPASGLVGVAVKAGRLCDHLTETGLLGPEAELVASLAIDLAWLMPLGRSRLPAKVPTS